MVDIEVLREEETETGYRFEVAVDHAGSRTTHTVTMRHADYERWGSEGGLAPATVARRSVEQLVRRVGHGRLQDSFDVREAMQLYPAFEAETYRLLE